jgi:transposase
VTTAAEPTCDLTTLLAAALAGTLTEAQAAALPRLGPEAIIAFAMAMAGRVAGLLGAAAAAAAAAVSAAASTPSGMKPVYEKPTADKRRRKTPGAKPGHPGSRRKPPVAIDHKVEHRLDACPCCGGGLQRCDGTRTRLIEDIPVDIKPEVTEHTIHRDYCPNCKKRVEPTVPDAMPGATLGHHAVALSGFFHYGLGVSIGQARDLLGGHLQMDVTAGGLVSAWQRMAGALAPWYEQIHRQLLDTACLHADETGWRVDGTTHWLWCFCDRDTCFYMIDRSRGGPALKRFFDEAFEGTLVTDFWAAYDAVIADDRQVCLPHLLRELVKVDERNATPEWVAFSKKLKRLLRDGIRLRKRPDFTPEKYRTRIDLIDRRLAALATATYDDPDAGRLAKRLGRFQDYYFTFLEKPHVPADNNHAERQIRPAVIQRKNILCNRSADGAEVQGVLMSVFRTLKLRGHDPTRTIAAALREFVRTGKLPPLPGPAVADG